MTVIVLFIIAYVINNKELSSPAVVFSGSFIALLMFSAINYQELGLHTLSWKTCMVITIGILSFFIGTLPLLEKTNRLKRKKQTQGKDLFYKVNVKKLVFFSIFEIIVIILTIRFYGLNSTNIADVLGGVRNSTVNNGEGVLPKYLALFNMVVFMSGIVFSVMIPRFYNNKRIKESLLTIICFMLSVLTSFSGGSRGSSLILIFSLLSNYIIEYYKKYDWKKEFKISSILKIAVLLFLILLAFKEISVIMGQAQVTEYSFSRYILIYIGAQLKNLDLAITSNALLGASQVFGQETFRSFVEFFSNVFGSGTYGSYELFLKFNYYNGLSLGNVYTTFYPYLRDFGYIGIVVCPMLMGNICEFLYFKVKEYSVRNNGVSIWDVLWSWTFFCLAFSFFSNKFYENIFCIAIIKYSIAAFIVLLFFFGLPITSSGKLKRSFW